MADGPFRDLGNGRRKNPRRNFHYFAKVLGPDTQWDGFIVDISESGAQLELFDTAGIPDDFALLVGGHGSVRRLCKVIWRTRDRLGVRFVRSPERLPNAPTSRP
jgi:hypothetical protein